MNPVKSCLKGGRGWALWLILLIPATQEAEIRRIVVQDQLGQIVQKTLSQKKKPITQKGWWSDSRYRPLVQTPGLQKKKKDTVKKIDSLSDICEFEALSSNPSVVKNKGWKGRVH
jgi:hypothetical protein